MDTDDMRRGVVPGVMAGYAMLAYQGANSVTSVTENVADAPTMSAGMIEMVGGMISADPFIGFILHVIISIVIGALYTAVFMKYVDLGNPLVNIVVGGLIYGLIWWIIGANIIMPAVAGGDILQLAIGPSFYGHIIFGHVLAFIVVLRDAALGTGDGG